MTKDDVLFGYRQQLHGGSEDERLGSMPPLQVLAPPATYGCARSTGNALRCCAPESAGGRKCLVF